MDIESETIRGGMVAQEKIYKGDLLMVDSTTGMVRSITIKLPWYYHKIPYLGHKIHDMVVGRRIRKLVYKFPKFNKN